MIPSSCVGSDAGKTVIHWDDCQPWALGDVTLFHDSTRLAGTELSQSIEGGEPHSPYVDMSHTPLSLRMRRYSLLETFKVASTLVNGGRVQVESPGTSSSMNLLPSGS